MLKSYNYQRFWFAVSLVIFFSGCGQGASQRTIDELNSRVRVYFEAEKMGAWSTTYDMRSAEFRSDVNKQTYTEIMNESSKCCTLVSHSNMGVKINKNYAKVTSEYRVDRHGSVEQYTKYMDTWVYERGNWFALDLGTRFYLPLNRSGVIPQQDGHIKKG